MLTCTGAAILFGWKEFFAPATIVAAFGGHWGNLIARCIMRLDRLPMVIATAHTTQSCQVS